MVDSPHSRLVFSGDEIIINPDMVHTLLDRDGGKR
jgi:hypothetical protein